MSLRRRVLTLADFSSMKLIYALSGSILYKDKEIQGSYDLNEIVDKYPNAFIIVTTSIEGYTTYGNNSKMYHVGDLIKSAKYGHNYDIVDSGACSGNISTDGILRISYHNSSSSTYYLNRCNILIFDLEDMKYVSEPPVYNG